MSKVNSEVYVYSFSLKKIQINLNEYHLLQIFNYHHLRNWNWNRYIISNFDVILNNTITKKTKTK